MEVQFAYWGNLRKVKLNVSDGGSAPCGRSFKPIVQYWKLIFYGTSNLKTYKMQYFNETKNQSNPERFFKIFYIS